LRYGIDNQVVNKVREGRPHVVDMIKNREIDLVINTTSGKKGDRGISFHSASGAHL
jgi:carbamoyl-phosphate synthase large subunit